MLQEERRIASRVCCLWKGSVVARAKSKLFGARPVIMLSAFCVPPSSASALRPHAPDCSTNTATATNVRAHATPNTTNEQNNNTDFGRSEARRFVCLGLVHFKLGDLVAIPGPGNQRGRQVKTSAHGSRHHRGAATYADRNPHTI